MALINQNKKNRFNSFKQQSPSSNTDSPKYSTKKQNQKKQDFSNLNPEKDILDEVQISPMKKTKVIMQFLYNPEYLLQDSYIIINE